MSTLSNFRLNPETTIQTADFVVDARGFKTIAIPGYKNSTYGGPCTLEEVETVNGVTRLKAKNGGSDYLFPWVNRGIGEVNVLRKSPEGTIVVTGGMNGCTLAVTENGPHLIFYHDADSCHLGVDKAATGANVCTVGPSQYIGPANKGESIVMETIGDGSAYLHQLIIIRHSGVWKVFGCGIVIGPGISMPIKRAFEGPPSKLLATF